MDNIVEKRFLVVHISGQEKRQKDPNFDLARGQIHRRRGLPPEISAAKTSVDSVGLGYRPRG